MIEAIKFILDDGIEVSFYDDEILSLDLWTTRDEQVMRLGSHKNAIIRYGKSNIERVYYNITFRLKCDDTATKIDTLYENESYFVLYYELLVDDSSADTVKLDRSTMKWNYVFAYRKANDPVTLTFYRSVTDGVYSFDLAEGLTSI